MFKTRKAEVESLRTALNDSCRLIAITRNGRMNVFTFIRNGEPFEIETMGLLSDDIAGWRKQAGI